MRQFQTITVPYSDDEVAMMTSLIARNADHLRGTVPPDSRFVRLIDQCVSDIETANEEMGQEVAVGVLLGRMLGLSDEQIVEALNGR